MAWLGIEPASVRTSSFRITWMILREHTGEAVHALHHRFTDSERQSAAVNRVRRRLAAEEVTYDSTAVCRARARRSAHRVP
jgi:hypothetical protein